MNNYATQSLKTETLRSFGFSGEKGGAHASRTIMLDELQRLFSAIQQPDAEREQYRSVIIEDNALGK